MTNATRFMREIHIHALNKKERERNNNKKKGERRERNVQQQNRNNVFNELAPTMK